MRTLLLLAQECDTSSASRSLAAACQAERVPFEPLVQLGKAELPKASRTRQKSGWCLVCEQEFAASLPILLEALSR
jgi:hypothetical protein